MPHSLASVQVLLDALRGELQAPYRFPGFANRINSKNGERETNRPFNLLIPSQQLNTNGFNDFPVRCKPFSTHWALDTLKVDAQEPSTVLLGHIFVYPRPTPPLPDPTPQ